MRPSCGVKNISGQLTRYGPAVAKRLGHGRCQFFRQILSGHRSANFARAPDTPPGVGSRVCHGTATQHKSATAMSTHLGAAALWATPDPAVPGDSIQMHIPDRPNVRARIASPINGLLVRSVWNDAGHSFRFAGTYFPARYHSVALRSRRTLKTIKRHDRHRRHQGVLPRSQCHAER